MYRIEKRNYYVRKKITWSVLFLTRFFPPRTFSGAWFLSAFILTASYGGNLRAFLLKPVLTDPVRTVDQLVSSGLPWNAVEYGDWAEKRITQSEDETLKVYWEGKNAVPFEDFPFDRVRILTI